MQFDIRRFDIYRKIPKDLTESTRTGAFISIGCVMFIMFLFVSELRSYLSSEVTSDMYVDDPLKHSERIPVYLDITVMKMDCKYLGLDIQDDLGRHEVGFVENVEKIPIGNGEGCRFKAHFNINKVPGNFHLSTHAAQEQPNDPDMNHIIHELIFGERVTQDLNLPGSFETLKGRLKNDAAAQNTHDYFIKVVPTIYVGRRAGQVLHAYQYTYAHREYLQHSHGHALPAVWFRYDLSPITVKYSVKHKPFYSFLTTMCAIIGGTFTVAGLLDSILFTASNVFKKAELGKLT